MYIYQREYKLVDHTLITIFHDAVCGVMPPLGGGLWWNIVILNFVRVGGHVFVYYQVFSCLILSM